MKTIKISRCTDGDWRIASRCTCKGSEPCPINGMDGAVFAGTLKAAIASWRDRRREPTP